MPEWQLMRKAALIIAVSIAATLSGAAEPQADVLVKGGSAWIRWLPGDLPAGGYIILHNQSRHAVSLLGASSPDYGMVMVHQSLMQGGVSRMIGVDRIALAPQSWLDFAKAGYHLMLERPSHPIRPGDHIVVTLKFDNGQSLPVDFDVEAANAHRE